VISIEHEDAEFGWPGKDLEARKEGERRALAYLRKALPHNNTECRDRGSRRQAAA
jgi:hypothetical protein